jgi:Tfp pilus assembly protein PilO
MAYNYKTELGRYRKYYQSLEPMLKKPKMQNYTAVVFSFLAISLFGWYAIRPTIQTILTLRRELQDKTDISKKMEDKIAALIEAQAAYSQVEPYLPAIDQALPPQPDAIPLVVQFQNLANASNVTISSVQLPAVPLLGQEATPSARARATAQTGKQQQFAMTIAVIGDYTGIQAFLSGVVGMRRIVSVDGFSLVPYKTRDRVATTSATTATDQQLQLMLKLQSYYLVQ